MSVPAVILACIFGIAAGAYWVLARRSNGRAVIYFWVAFAVALLQTLALAVASAYPPISEGAYVIVLSVVGLALLSALTWLAHRYGGFQNLR